MVFSPHDSEAIAAVRRRHGLDPLVLRRFLNALLKDGAEEEAALSLLPPAFRRVFESEARLSSLGVSRRHDSMADGASKFAFRTADGHVVESVLLRVRSGRACVCVSTQAGCAGGCRFCATGAGGFARSLTRDEILDQVVHAVRVLRREEGRGLRNVVFMGMGEPFHNEAELHAALGRLLAPDGFGLSARKITVSTLGVPEAMERCAACFPLVGQAVSLHSARPEVREWLMPLARFHPLPRLREAMERVCALSGRPIFVECLLLEGVNDGPEDAAALADYLRGLSAHVNVIPFNPVDAAAEFQGAPESRRLAFAAALRTAGFTVTTRRSLGGDIGAGCGQLAGAGRAKAGEPASAAHA